MNDLISRAAALDAIFGCFNVMESKGIDMTVARTIVKGVLDGAPTIDAAPVVRCKDCRYWQDNNGGYPHEDCRWGHDETPDPDDYCSFGERRDKDGSTD